MADRQALGVVAQLVLAQEADRPGEADLDAEVDEPVFEPLRAAVAVVDELAVAAERVAEEEHAAGVGD